MLDGRRKTEGPLLLRSTIDGFSDLRVTGLFTTDELQNQADHFGLRLEGFNPRTRRRASSIRCICRSSTLPRRLASRSLDIVRICSHLHHEFSERPFDPSGVKGTWKGTSFPFVPIAATMTLGYLGFRLAASVCTTRAGRMPDCSEPRDGLQSTSHISPRKGSLSLILEHFLLRLMSEGNIRP